MNFATDVVVNDSNTLQAKTIKALTATNSSTFGVGTTGQVLTSNGTNAYWGAATGISAAFIDTALVISSSGAGGPAAEEVSF